MRTQTASSVMDEHARQLFSKLAITDGGLSSSPASPGYFLELSRVERGLIRDTVRKIQQAITDSDRIGSPGLVYVAKQKGTRFTKVGYSSHEDASRTDQISGTCGLEFEKIYQIPMLPYGAFRAEQILHKVLRQWGYDILNCKCLKEHREWYDKSFDFIITLANLVHTWMRQEPYSTQNWELKPDWNNALNVWISSQDTRTPMAWSEFFLMGLLLKPIPPAFPGSPPTPSRFWKRRKSASVTDVGCNSTPSARPKGPVHADSSPVSLRSNRTPNDSPFRDANSTPRLPSISRAEITPSKLPSRRAVDESPSETHVRHVSSLNTGLNKKREGFLDLSETMRSKGDKDFSCDLLNTNNEPAITTEVVAAKEDQCAEEDSTAEESLTVEESSTVEEDPTAEEDSTVEEDSAAEEDSTGEEDQTVQEGSEEGSTAEEDQRVEEGSEEGSTAEEDQRVEEGSEEDSTAEEDQRAEEGSEEGSTAEEDQRVEEGSEEGSTAEEDQRVEEGSEEDSTAEEDQRVEEGSEEDSTAEEDQRAEEGSEEDSTAEEDQIAEEGLAKQEESLAGNDSTREESVEDGESGDDEGSDYQYTSTTDEDSASDIEWTEEELARERQELTHEVRELLREAEGLVDLGRDDIIAGLEETFAVDETVVVSEGLSTDGAKEPPFPDSSLDVQSKVLHQDSEADPEVAPEDELQSGLENEPPADAFTREKCSKVLAVEKPAVDEDAAEERNELEDESGRIAPPTAQVKRSRLGRSDRDQEEAPASPNEHVLTSQDLAENGKSSVSPTVKAPPKSVDRDEQNSHDKLEGFSCESTAITSSGKARDLFMPISVQKPTMKEGYEVTLQTIYTVHPGTAPSEPLRFCCDNCCHFDGNIISPDKEEILRSGGEISPPRCVACGSERQLFRYLPQETDPDVQPIVSPAPSEKDHGSLRAFQEGPSEANPHNEQNQSTDPDTGVGDNAATLPQSTGLPPSSPKCTSPEKAAMATEQISPRVAKEPPSHLFGQAPAGIQVTEFEESRWNDTDWTGVFGGGQAELHTSFPAHEATKGHESGGDHEDKS